MMQKITPQTAQHLSQLICLGRGRRSGAAWLNDTTLSVSTTLGMWNYHTDRQEEYIGSFEDNYVHSVSSIIYSPDNRSIAYLGGVYREIVYVHDVPTWRNKFTVSPPPNTKQALFDIAFSPDGNLLAGSSGYDVFIWEANTGKLVHHWTGENGAFCKVMFTPDSKTLIDAGYKIRVWDVVSGDQIYELSVASEPMVLGKLILPPSPQTAIMSGKGLRGGGSISPDGTKFAATTILGNTLWIWSLKTSEQLLTLKTNHVTDFAFDPSGTLLAVGGLNELQLYNFETQTTTFLEEFERHYGKIAFSPDGTLLASGSFDDTLRVWDVKQSEAILTIENAGYQTIAFNPNGSMIACAKRDDTLCLLNISTSEQKTFQQGHSGRVYTLVMNSSDATIATSSDDHSARLWSINTGHHRKSVHVFGGDSPFFAFSPNGKLLLSSDSDKYKQGAMWIQDLETGERLLTKEGVNPINFSPDSQWVAYSEYGIYGGYKMSAMNIQTQEIRTLFKFELGEYGFLRNQWRYLQVHRRDQSTDILELETTNVLLRLTGTVQSSDFSEDGKYLLTSSSLEENPLLSLTEVREIASGEKILEYRGNFIGHLLSPDGKTLIFRSPSNEAPQVFDVEHNELRAALPIAKTHIFAFSQDSTLFASGDQQDGSVKVWQTNNCKHLITLTGHRGRVSNLKFSDDQMLLVSAGEDGTVRIWDLLRQVMPR